MQDDDEAEDHVPAVHVVHDVALADEYVPAEHPLQLPRPDAELYVPATHVPHDEAPPLEYNPAEHKEHDEAVAPANEPALHVVQLPDPDVAKEPLRQPVQVEAPAKELCG